MSDIDSIELRVHPDLEFASQKIHATAEQLKEDLHRLQRDLQPVLDHWQGQNKDMYELYQGEWNQAAKDLFAPADEGGFLGMIAEQLDKIWRGYVGNELGNAITWKH